MDALVKEAEGYKLHLSSSYTGVSKTGYLEARCKKGDLNTFLGSFSYRAKYVKELCGARYFGTARTAIGGCALLMPPKHVGANGGGGE